MQIKLNLDVLHVFQSAVTLFNSVMSAVRFQKF